MISMIKEKIAGAIYGMALGDAMGMPSELWTKEKIHEYFGVITDFLDGPSENDVARYYKKGQFTDDTAQALVLIESLITTNFEPNKKDFAKRLLSWAEDNKALERNILGPASKAALIAFKKGKVTDEITDKALSNGSAMRIVPVGCLFQPYQKQELVQFVKEISSVTHSSDITIAGAAIIAQGVSSAIIYNDFEMVVLDMLEIEAISKPLGARTFSPSLTERIHLGIYLAKRYKNNEQIFMKKLYDLVGAGVSISESVPAAVAIAYYTQEPNQAAILSANLGGDTDTIGAMATAICGAFCGVERITTYSLEVLRRANSVNFEKYVDILIQRRYER